MPQLRRGEVSAEGRIDRLLGEAQVWRAGSFARGGPPQRQSLPRRTLRHEPADLPRLPQRPIFKQRQLRKLFCLPCRAVSAKHGAGALPAVPKREVRHKDRGYSRARVQTVRPNPPLQVETKGEFAKAGIIGVRPAGGRGASHCAGGFPPRALPIVEAVHVGAFGYRGE